MQKNYAVSGLTCEHCASAVREEIGRLDGVRSVEVDLVPGGTSNVAVTCEQPLHDAEVADALTEAGDYVLARPGPDNPLS